MWFMMHPQRQRNPTQAIVEDSCGILMRFQTKKIGIVADIEKFFLQIGLQPKERNVTRFLWLKDINLPVTPANIITYCFTRVPFGIISSPFLLGATIKHHLGNGDRIDECNTHRDIYLDNLITGVNSKGEACRLYETTKFKEMSMNLRKFSNNDEDASVFAEIME